VTNLANDIRTCPRHLLKCIITVERELITEAEALKMLHDESTVLQSAEPVGTPLELEVV